MVPIDFLEQLEGIIDMIKQISNNVVYVTGYKCSAIYDFSEGKVYSINEQGTQIMTEYLTTSIVSKKDNEFIQQVLKIIKSSNMEKKDYRFPEPTSKQLNFAWLELTQRCTSRCIHCYEGNEHVEVKEPLSFIEWQKVISDLSLLGCKSIQFIGGEPSLYKKLPLLIDYAKNKNITNISIFSNLYIMSKQLEDAIVRNNVSVHFSIYGSDGVFHDAITQVNGSFSNMINNIRKLLQHNVKLTAHVVIMKENEQERDKIYLLLERLGVTLVRYDEVRKVYGGCQDKHLVKNSKVMMTKPNFKADINWFNSAYYRNTCWYGKCVISTDGSVYPCEFEHSILYGNVREESILDIIAGESVDKYWYWDFSKVDTCKDCEYRFACKDCRPLAFAENGSMLEKNPRCKYNPHTGLWNV